MACVSDYSVILSKILGKLEAIATNDMGPHASVMVEKVMDRTKWVILVVFYLTMRHTYNQ